MTQVKFLFDIVVTRLKLSGDQIDEPQNLLVNVKLNNRQVKITASRINVNDLHAGRQVQWTADPEVLRKNLGKDGMLITVRYCGKGLGTGHIMFPPSYVKQIDHGMSDLMHRGSCRIADSNGEVGTLELLCYLTIKCEENELDLEQRKQSWTNEGKTINPNDILFLVGRPESCPAICEPCLEELPPEEGDVRLKMDISRYSSFNQPAILTSEDAVGTTACALLRAQIAVYEKFIDSVVETISYLTAPLRGVRSHVASRQGKATSCAVPVPLDGMAETGIKPIRACPVCLTSMPWLPKYACCPKCWAMPMPVLRGNSKEQLTSDQIIQQYCKDSNQIATALCDKDKRRRCSCQLDKICPHCRVRNKYANIFASKKSEHPNNNARSK